MRVLKSSLLLALATPLLLLAACGPDTEPVEPLAWPFIEKTEALKVNGKDFSAYLASSEMHRRRALNGLAIKPDQAIAYLYPAQEDEIEIKLNNVSDPIDLVFVDASAKVLKVESVPAFSQATFPRAFAAKGARLVLQFRQGVAKDLSLSAGSEVKTEPNLIEKAAKAEGEFAQLFFLRNQRPEDKPEDAPSVQLRVLEKAEDVARFMKDRDDLAEGQGVLVPYSGGYHEFWLKEVKGKVCACFIERVGTGYQRSTVVSAIYEGIEDTGSSDLDRPVYYSPTEAAYLAVWKGSDFFTKNKIDRRSPVTVAGVDVYQSIAPDYNKFELKFGDKVLDARLAVTDDARNGALATAAALESDKAVVLAWDDPSQVEVTAPAGANLWFIDADGGKYSVGRKVVGTGGKVEGAAKSRFVLLLPAGFESSAELKFPYILRDLRPSLPAVVFYNAKQADVVTDRWPGTDNSAKGRARVELAITPAEQRRGLMYRESLRENHGMLFIYNAEIEDLSYWMKNCRMNLSIAFLDAKGVIVKIHNVMKAPAPGTTDGELDHYEAGAPAKYAIEMKENWFAEKGIKEGDRVFLPPALANRK